VCTFHDAAVFDFPQAYTITFLAWYRFLMRRVGRTASLLMTVSDFSRSRLVARIGIAPERVTVVHGSGEHLRSIVADIKVLARLGVRKDSYFLAVGSANPVKNFRLLCTAFADLPARFGGQLVIVGGANQGVFAADVEHTTHSSRIVHAGTLSDAELKALYQSAFGLVFPSLYEGFGLPLLEAMACGCPVAASSAASIPEVCGDAALYFDPHSSEGIAAAMMRLFDEPELRGQLRERGTRRAATFSWASSAGELLQRLTHAVPTAA
jgi:glycosyltransferase involved in cell wall biosynthesis